MARLKGKDGAYHGELLYQKSYEYVARHGREEFEKLISEIKGDVRSKTKRRSGAKHQTFKARREDAIRALLRNPAMLHTVSLNTLVDPNGEEGGDEIIDRIATEDTTFRACQVASLERLFERVVRERVLSDREMLVVCLCFGISHAEHNPSGADFDGVRVKEISEFIGLSGAHVSQIKMSALNKIRRFCSRNKIGPDVIF